MGTCYVMEKCMHNEVYEGLFLNVIKMKDCLKM